jgi:uncharacterized protein YecE (DUF72 family)
VTQQSFGFEESVPQPARAVPLGPSRVFVGTCGYSYRDWIGPFYPLGTKSNGMLPYYATRFPAVEIDATYYRIPGAATFASMDARTPPEFRFSVKLPSTLTHLPADAAPFVSDDARIFREVLEPLRASGKLAGLLAQFPNSFRAGERGEDYLRALSAEFAGLPLVVEFRNREWQTPETLKLLEELGAAWCNVDEPLFEGLLRPSSDVVGSLAYVRFHGRNAQKWWKHDDAAERYDYEYAPEELAPWAARVGEMAALAPQTYAFFNNHRFGKAPRSAELFESLLLP